MPKRKKSAKTRCGVPEKIVSKYGICEAACTPAKMGKCQYHKSDK